MVYLFTTDDGGHIYEGDEYHTLNKLSLVSDEVAAAGIYRQKPKSSLIMTFKYEKDLNVYINAHDKRYSALDLAKLSLAEIEYIKELAEKFV